MVSQLPQQRSGDSNGLGWLKLLLAAVALVGLIVVWRVLPLAQWIESLRTWVADLGLLGHLIFAAVYAVAAVVLAPGSLLTLAAGLAFGLAGFPTVVIGATIGAGLSFLVGRYYARGWVERQTSASPLFKAIDRAIEAEGWKVVGLMRLSPLVPFNLQNYFFGITKVDFVPYLVTTFFGIMPGTLLYIWIGSLGATAGAGFEGGWSQENVLKATAFVVGLVATAIVTIIVSIKAKQKLKEAGVE